MRGGRVRGERVRGGRRVRCENARDGTGGQMAGVSGRTTEQVASGGNNMGMTTLTCISAIILKLSYVM